MRTGHFTPQSALKVVGAFFAVVTSARRLKHQEKPLGMGFREELKDQPETPSEMFFKRGIKIGPMCETVNQESRN